VKIDDWVGWTLIWSDCLVNSWSGVGVRMTGVTLDMRFLCRSYKLLDLSLP
jgi:hypothetical protein